MKRPAWLTVAIAVSHTANRAAAASAVTPTRFEQNGDLRQDPSPPVLRMPQVVRQLRFTVSRGLLNLILSQTSCVLKIGPFEACTSKTGAIELYPFEGRAVEACPIKFHSFEARPAKSRTVESRIIQLRLVEPGTVESRPLKAGPVQSRDLKPRAFQIRFIKGCSVEDRPV